MARDLARILAAFLSAGKPRCLFGREIEPAGIRFAGKSGGALPVDYDGEPSMLIRVEAQPIRRPAPLA